MLKSVETTCDDSFDLFYALYSHNPASSEQLQTFSDALSELQHDLKCDEAWWRAITCQWV